MAEYCPRGLAAPGRKLWRSVTSEFELAEHERVILLECCRTVDVCHRLETTAAKIRKPAAVLTELRMQRATLARLFAVLKLPAGEAVAPNTSTFRQRAIR